MESSALSGIFSSVNSFEAFEKLKQNIEIFEDAAKEITRRHQLPDASLTLFSEGTNIVFAYGKHQVIKIFPPFHLDQFKSEQLVLKHLQAKLSIKTPTIEHDGEIMG